MVKPSLGVLDKKKLFFGLLVSFCIFLLISFTIGVALSFVNEIFGLFVAMFYIASPLLTLVILTLPNILIFVLLNRIATFFSRNISYRKGLRWGLLFALLFGVQSYYGSRIFNQTLRTINPNGDWSSSSWEQQTQALFSLDDCSQSLVPDQCFYLKAVKNKDVVFCDKISDQKIQESCLKTFSLTDQTAEKFISYEDNYYGFIFKYPATWKLRTGLEKAETSIIIAKVTNPTRSGKSGTDVPIEQFLVLIAPEACDNKLIRLGTKKTDTGWSQGFGLIYYRNLCFKTENNLIGISMSAYDQQSQVIMDKMLSTFKFTR